MDMIRYLADLGVSRRKIAELHFKGRISRTTVGYILDFGKVPSKADLMALKQASLPNRQLPQRQEKPRDLSREIDCYQPALASSFNSGLGSITPPSVVNRVVRESNSEVRSFIDFRRARFDLLSVLNEKKLDPIGNRFRELLKKRVSSLGFDSSSDNDVQFGQLNDMAEVGLAVVRLAGKKAVKLKLPQLVDAAILYRRPDWKIKLEESDRQLRCTRCRKLRSFIKSKDSKSVTCLSCGLELPVEKARFRIPVRRIDPEYVDLVHSVVLSKSRGSGLEPRPSTSPRQARNHIGVCVNESTSQSSE